MAAPLPAAAVLAGGLGTRIREMAGSTPKVLLPVEGRPFILHLLEYLAREGVENTVLCLGHGAEEVWKAARSGTPEGIRLSASHEDNPLGTAGPVRKALSRLGDEFFVLNGDTYLEVSLSGLLSLHRKHNAWFTLCLVRADQAGEKGSVRVSPEGKVLEFSEKIARGTGLINGGVYAARAEAFASIPEGVYSSLEREVIPRAIEEGREVRARIEEAPLVDIGLPDDYREVRNRLPRKDHG